MNRNNGSVRGIDAAMPGHLQAVLDSAFDAIIFIDQLDQIESLNHAAEDMFGRRAAEAIGRPIGWLLPGGVPLPPGENWDGARESDGLLDTNRVAVALRADGSRLPVEISVGDVRYSGRRVIAVRGAGSRQPAPQSDGKALDAAWAQLRAKSDELEIAMRQLWQVSKLAALGELAAGIAHELNNPLATIGLRVESVLTKLPGNDAHRSALEVVGHEIERMAKLVSNLLQFSRRGANCYSTLDLREELQLTLDLIAHQLRRRQIEADRVFDANVPLVQADRDALRQVFLNLLTNAVDAMPGGGKLTMRGSPRVIDGCAGAVVEVIDSGAGIPAEILNRVMEPFFTTKDEGKGTGLGLPICRRIVEEHGGSLQIESAVGQGTTVRVFLPSTPPENRARDRENN